MVAGLRQEVQVKSSGYAAEFGGSTGGVINVITRSGSNDFHGDAGLYFNDDAHERRRAPHASPAADQSAVAEYITFPKDKQPAHRARHRRRRPDAEGPAVVLRQLPAVPREVHARPRSSATARRSRASRPTRTHYLSANVTVAAHEQQHPRQDSPTTRPSATSSASCRVARCRRRTARRRRRRCSTPTTSGRTARSSGNYDYVGQRQVLRRRPRRLLQARTSSTKGIPTETRFIFARPTSAWPACRPSSSRPTELHEHPDQPQRHRATSSAAANFQVDGTYYAQLRRLAHDQGRRAVRPDRQRRARLGTAAT